MATRAVNIATEKCDVYVGRPSTWGNPFRIGPDGSRAEVIDSYRRHLRNSPELIVRARKELKGKRLGCHCAPLACHAQVLAEVAEGAEP